VTSKDKRITTVEEIKNIVLLGLDVWVFSPIAPSSLSSEQSRNWAWRMSGLILTRNENGLLLGSELVRRDYLPKWGIVDPNCIANLYITEGSISRLYNTQQAAQNAINRRLTGTSYHAV